MIHPGAALQGGDTGARVGGRSRLTLLVAAIAAFAAFLPASAGANVTPTASTVYSTNVAGAHGDYTIVQEFAYDSGTEPVAGTEDLKKWIVDSPAGLVGNPNAIPEADRCDPAAFDPSGTMSSFVTTGACPASSLVGQAKVYLVNDASSGACPAAPLTCLTAGFDMYLLAGPMTGNIYLLKTTPEVPTTLGTLFTSASYQNFGSCVSAPAIPCPLQPKTKSVIQPVTTESGQISDFRLRTVPAEYSSPPAALLPTAYGHAAIGAGGTPLHIRRIDQKLYGHVGNDPAAAAFLSFPTNCGPWDSKSYARAHVSNAGTVTGLDPNNTADAFKESNVDSKTDVDCSTLPSFAPTASLTLSTMERGTNPEATFTVDTNGNPGVDYPKKVVNTLPASLNIDVANLPTPCETSERNANACPASSKVGTATVTTPLIVSGLTGDIYMIRGTGKALPDLAIFFNNPPNSIQSFRMDGTTKYVGAGSNQIETTFDSGPQNPWTSFKLTFTGGSSGLLKTLSCPDGTASPEDGPITFAMTGFSGQSASTTTTPALKDCFGVDKLKKIKKCVKSKLKVSPGYDSRDQISKAELWIKAKGSKKYKKVKTAKKSPFRFSYKLSSKYKKGKHAYRIRAVYKASPASPSGTVKTRTSSFKRC